jgi:MYXO-CTERM domain-containing protein
MGILVALLPSIARANGRPAQTSTILVDPNNPNRLWVGATFGALVSEDGGQNWRLVCEVPLGTFGFTIDPAYRITPSCLTLAGTQAGLIYSRDNGCNWDHSGGSITSTTSIIDVALHPSNHSRVLLATNVSGQMNAVHLSNDGGTTFAATSATVPMGTVFRSVKYAADGNHAYAMSSDGSITHIFTSTDGGQSWTQTSYSSTAESAPVLIGADPRDPLKVYYYARALGLHHLHRSTDGGATFSEVTSDIATIFIGLFKSDGTLYLATNQGIRKSPDGLTIGPPATASEIPVTCLAIDGNTLYGCGSDSTDGFSIGKSTDDGANWTKLLKFNENIVGPIVCGPSAQVCTQCYSMWPTFAMQFGLPNTTQPACMDPGATTCMGSGGSGGSSGSGGSGGSGGKGGGCSCSVGSVVPSFLGVLPLVGVAVILLRRRRK